MRRQLVGPEYMHVSFAEKEKKAAREVDAKKVYGQPCSIPGWQLLF
jgi:hypothetical protein